MNPKNVKLALDIVSGALVVLGRILEAQAKITAAQAEAGDGDISDEQLENAWAAVEKAKEALNE